MKAQFPLKELLPFDSHYLQIGNSRLHYLDEPAKNVEPGVDAPVAILLHGNPTWCYYYRNLIPELRKDFRVIAIDYIGCGLSDHPENEHYRFNDRVDQVEAVVKHLGLRKYSLVMHDWGGPIGTAFALRNLPAIERLVYFNTTLTETESLPGIIRRAANPIIGKFLTKFSTSFLRLTTELGVTKTLPKPVKAGYFYPYETSARRQAIWDFVADIPFTEDHPSYPAMMDLAQKLPLLSNTPIQIIWGLRDPCFHREMLTQVARHFPHANVLEIPDAAHLVLEDAPELAIPTAVNFLKAQKKTKDAAPEGDKSTSGVAPIINPPSVNALFASFLEHASTSPRHDAVVVPTEVNEGWSYAHTNYQSLLEKVSQYQRGLTQLGLAAGDRVLMLVPAGVEFLALSYAVMGNGAVPVFIDPGIGIENVLKCCLDADPHAFITAPKGHMLRLLNRRAFKKLKFHLTVSDWPISTGATLNYLRRFSTAPVTPAACGTTGMIAFTSGATGTPKGVQFSNRVLSSQLSIFTQTFGLSAGKSDLPLLPIFSLFNLALGVSSVVAPIDPKAPLTLDPRKIVRIIRDLSVQTSFGSPTLWNKISDYCVRSSERLESIEKILMAGAAVPLATLEKVQSIIPNGEAFTPYGATEALPVTFVSSRRILEAGKAKAISGEEGTYVGSPVPGVEVKIIRPVNAAIKSAKDINELPALQIGEIIVRGANVSAQYLNRPDANKQGKIPGENVDGSDMWHRMGDMGYVDAQQNLYYCGRKSHVVSYQSSDYHSVPLETIFDKHPKVRRSALVRLDPSGEPAIVVEPQASHWPAEELMLRTFLSELEDIAHANPLTQNISKFFFHPSFPVDARHNAKIFRDKLGVWASEQNVTQKKAANY